MCGPLDVVRNNDNWFYTTLAWSTINPSECTAILWNDFSFYQFHFRFPTLFLVVHNIDDVTLNDGWCMIWLFYLSAKYKWHDGDGDVPMNSWKKKNTCTLRNRSRNVEWKKIESTDLLSFLENVFVSVSVVDSHQLKNVNLFLNTSIWMRQCHRCGVALTFEENTKKNESFARRIKGK